MQALNRPTVEQNKKVIEFYPEFTKLINYYIKPIIFGELPLKSEDATIRGATITFIDTGSKSFGITNWHVYDEFKKQKKRLELFSCRIGNLEIDLDSRLIDMNKDLDLATFDLTNSEFDQIDIKPLYHKKWPVAYKKEKTEPVYILGYPGHLRKIESFAHIVASYGTLMMIIENITDKRLNIVFDRANWNTSLVKDIEDISVFRGFSGAGVFRMNGIVPELLSIVTDHGEDFDILFTTKSDLISKYGKIKSLIC